MQLVAQRQTRNAKPSALARIKDFVFGAKEATVYDLDIKFHRDCAGDVTHGMLSVTNKERKLDNTPIAFKFVGISHAPQMTPDVICHVFNKALEAGYLPHHLTSYKTL